MSVPITEVTGGSAGLAATYARVLALAAAYDAAGSRMRGWAATGARILADGDLVESAVLAPVTFAVAEAAVLDATTGPDGILVESLGWETDAVLVRVAVRALEETDDLVHGALAALDYLVGRTLGLSLVVAGPALLTAGLVAGPHLSPALRRRLCDWPGGHPGAVEHLVAGGGGLLDGLWDGLTPLAPGGPFGVGTFTPDTESAAGLLAALYGAESAYAVRRTGLRVPSGNTQPGTLADLVTHLGQTNDLSDAAHPENNGTIEVQTIRDGHGHVRHIVYLPGTDDMATLPWTQDGDVRDLPTNLLLIRGRDNAYLDGILAAMHEAGVGPHDPVLLAGHSQGGMEAAAILAQHHDFNVTNVVTAGSPTAQVTGFPPGSHVLSLENRGDVVPLLDGGENPDSVEQVTVHFDDRGSSVADSHALTHYARGAAAVDASCDPSVREQLRSLRDHGFLGVGGPGGSVTSQVFQVTRSP